MIFWNGLCLLRLLCKDGGLTLSSVQEGLGVRVGNGAPGFSGRAALMSKDVGFLLVVCFTAMALGLLSLLVSQSDLGGPLDVASAPSVPVRSE
jgi:hypothetical protein